jgi:hypothetical protein
MSQFPIQPRTQGNDLRAASPDGDERANRAVKQCEIAPSKDALVLELNATHIMLIEWSRPSGKFWVSELCFCHFGFDDLRFDDLRLDDRRQNVNTLEVLLIEIGMHQLDAEMPLNLQHELKNVDGIDFQLATEQRLIVAQILRGQVGDP